MSRNRTTTSPNLPARAWPARAGTLAALALAGALLAGCQTSGKSEEAVTLPGITINLPPTPAFTDLDQPTSFPDGSMTIWGLHKSKKDYLNKEVKVKAYLLDVYACPKCPRHQKCPACEQPHFFLSDKPGGKLTKALMVVDYLGPKDKPPALTVGKQYDVDGTYAINSPSGFAASDGLLVFKQMTDDKNKLIVSPSARMEAEELKGEAAEAAKLQQAAKTRAAAMKKE